jgi:hypothetical protein
MTGPERESRLRAMYCTMRTPELKLLQQAFLLDLEHGADREFCHSRLRLIDAVLFERRQTGAADDRP